MELCEVQIFLQPPKRYAAACSSLPSKNFSAGITASLEKPSSTSLETLASNAGPCINSAWRHFSLWGHHQLPEDRSANDVIV